MANEIIIDLGSSLKTLQDMQGKLKDTTRLTRRIAALMHADISDHFESEKGPEGEPWKDLAESTKTQRKKKGHWPGKKLQVTRGLLQSLQPAHTESEASVTSATKYSAIHHFGGQAGPGRKVTIPARPYMYLSTAAEEQIEQIIRKHILDQ